MEKQLNSSVRISRDIRHYFFFEEIQQDKEKRKIQPEEFTDQIIFMWSKRKNDENRVSKVQNYAMRFSQEHWALLGPGSEEKWYGNTNHDQRGQWNCTADKMVQQFKETGHPVFKGIRTVSLGVLKQNKGRNLHSLQRRFFEHRTLVPKNSLCKSGQCLRNSGDLVLSVLVPQKMKRDEPLLLWTKILTKLKPEEVQFLVSQGTQSWKFVL